MGAHVLTAPLDEPLGSRRMAACSDSRDLERKTGHESTMELFYLIRRLAFRHRKRCRIEAPEFQSSCIEIEHGKIDVFAGAANPVGVRGHKRCGRGLRLAGGEVQCRPVEKEDQQQCRRDGDTTASQRQTRPVYCCSSRVGRHEKELRDG